MRILNKFKIRIDHRNWQNALALSFAYLVAAEAGELIVIVGPPRAGKTQLALELCKLLFGEQVFDQTVYMPAVLVDATNSSKNGSFSTKDFMARVLRAIKHPMFQMADETEGANFRRLYEATSESVMRGAAEEGFKARKTQYFFIDEGHHVKYVSKDPMAASAVMDSLKCFAKDAGIVLVIVGTYELLGILQGSEQLLGRKHQIHFPRYYSSEEDLSEFASIINSYEKILKINSSLGSLNNCIEILYKYSLGCIGLLRAWLKRADAMASISNGEITKEILLKTRLSDNDILTISTKITAGENDFLISDLNSEAQNSKSPKKPTNKKPFQRNPKRYTKGGRI